MAWTTKKSAKRIRRNQTLLSVILLLVLLLAGGSVWYLTYGSRDKPAETSSPKPAETSTPTQDEAEKPSFDSLSLQAAVDDWVSEQNGTSSVIVADEEGNIVAAYNGDQVYFAASLYKLFVAYEGYRQIDAGDVDADEVYLNGNTRAECLDLMIRESNSPCGEKMLAELGGLKLTNQLREYDITNTSMVSISTTARDSAVILARVARGEGLSQTSRADYLDSMKDQPDIYRRGLPSGFSDKLTVYNKVGWNELVEWHDAAIVELADGRNVIITALTKNVGSANVADLATRLEAALQP